MNRNHALVGLLGLATIILSGCDGTSREEVAPPSGTETASETSAGPESETSAVPGTDPATSDGLLESSPAAYEVLIRALEDSLSRFPDHTRMPDWLYQLGGLWRENLAAVTGSAIIAEDVPELAVEFSQYFRAPCCSVELLYTLGHFERLVAMFPEDPAADDAAYMLTRAPVLGECEGSVSCYLSREVTPLRDFLHAYPASPHALEAIERANSLFLTEFTTARSSRNFDSTAVLSVFAAYDSTVGALPPPLQALAYSVIGPISEGLGAASRSRRAPRLRCVFGRPESCRIWLRGR